MKIASISEGDKVGLNSGNVVLFIYKSNFKLMNMFITTQYEAMDSFHYLFKILEMGYQWFSIENSHFIVEGSILSTSNHYMNLRVINTLFDMYKSQGGFQIDMSCSNATTLPETFLIFDKIKFFFSKGKSSLIFLLFFIKLMLLNRKTTIIRLH